MPKRQRNPERISPVQEQAHMDFGFDSMFAKIYLQIKNIHRKWYTYMSSNLPFNFIAAWFHDLLVYENWNWIIVFYLHFGFCNNSCDSVLVRFGLIPLDTYKIYWLKIFKIDLVIVFFFFSLERIRNRKRGLGSKDLQLYESSCTSQCFNAWTGKNQLGLAKIYYI